MAPAERGASCMRMAQRCAIVSRNWPSSRAATTASRCGRRADVQVAARYFEFFAGIADKIMGNTIPLGPGYLDYTVREPIGVSAQIMPWNYPIQIGARGVAPALAAGCVVCSSPRERR
jgi:acyl-CoA reductase-like NAD-dependent aldehyde dehydrogenase